jgi:hypothetical protein
MRDEVVEQAINVSRELQGGLGAMDPSFAFLREVLGVTYRNLRPETARGENWGYLVREMTPFPSVQDERQLVPGFSLFGRDFFEQGIPPLLFELAGDMGGHFFDLLVASLEERCPKIGPEDFREPCREEFARIFPEHEKYLPRTVQYFSEERDRFGKPLYRDTGKAPEWRP